jgi:hypothetical protein
MYIYNVTTKITADIIEEWIKWQQQEHIPEIMATGLFTEYRFFRLLEEDETEGPTFIIQYVTDEMSKYSQFVKDHAPALRQKALSQWGDRFIAFRTVMQTVH